MYSFVICLASLRWRHVLANRKWWNNKNNNNDNDNLKITFSPFHFFPLLSNLPTPFFFLSHFPSPPFSLSTHFPSPILVIYSLPHSTFFWPNSSPPLLSPCLLYSSHPIFILSHFQSHYYSRYPSPYYYYYYNNFSEKFVVEGNVTKIFLFVWRWQQVDNEIKNFV